ncbi:hypothetical protein ACLB1S_00125 [Escherichia coli]
MADIIANMLQEHDNPFTLYPYDTNYLIYTQTSDLKKKRLPVTTGRKMRVRMK